MDRQAVQERFGIIGTSAALRHAIDRTRLVARTDVSVLIEGESGTGKELITNAIHGLSLRRHGPLQIINMGAIPEGLIEAELFGAEKGSYSSSIERRIGYFEKANGGTIFLDEIGEMPPAAQVRLLRVLESGTFNRVGSSTMRSTDARVVAATNKNLGREVQAGRFREDLYYRISTVIIRLPPLRERQEDIMPLFRRFLYEFAQKYSASMRQLSKDAEGLLQQYAWPGNVRELRNVAEAATITSTSKAVEADMLRPLLRGVTQEVSAAMVPVAHTDDANPNAYQERALIYRTLLNQQVTLGELRDEVFKLRTGLEKALSQTNGDVIQTPPVPMLPGPVAPKPNRVVEYEEVQDGEDNEQEIPTLVESERMLIARALEHFGGNKRRTAKALGISERSLYRRIKDAQQKNV